jgi:hypothetical protein
MPNLENLKNVTICNVVGSPNFGKGYVPQPDGSVLVVQPKVIADSVVSGFNISKDSIVNAKGVKFRHLTVDLKLKSAVSVNP